MKINEIMSVLPHRYPFLFIDEIVELEVGKRVLAKKNVSMNEHFFIGHFPQKPVMPGVLIVEALAQAGAVAVLSCEEHHQKIVYLVGLDRVKFRKQVVPGDQLLLEVEMINMKSNAGKGKGIAYVNKQKVAEALLTFMIG